MLYEPASLLCLCCLCFVFVLEFSVFIRLVDSHRKHWRALILLLALLLILIIIIHQDCYDVSLF